MNLSYREARVEDAAGIATVDVVSQQSAYRGFLPAAHLDGMSTEEQRQRWQGALGADVTDRTIVAVDTTVEKVVGFVRAGKSSDPGVGGITHLFVLPEYWGMGVGQALMHEAIEVMRGFGTVSARLYVYRDNTRGRRFYDRQGWKPDGRTYDHEFDAVVFPLLCYVKTFE